jgi:hypothetical protein
MLYGNDRRQLREVMFKAWRKQAHGEPLEGIEQLIVAVARRHPEYHAILENEDANADRDYNPDSGEHNPFLHLAFHMAIEEQLAVNQPPGLRDHYQRLCIRQGDEHEAQHRVMECLAEMIWQAGRGGTAPDPKIYLDCLEKTAE